jgi:enoyl-CoA hydratase
MNDGTSDGELVVERRGPVLVARLNRPEARNALTAEVIRALGAALAGAESDPSVRVVVLTGTGDRAFCAGMDLRAFADAATVQPDGAVGRPQPGESDHRGGDLVIDDSHEMRAFERFLRGEIGVPVIGAANGTAVAGGLELLLGCDLVVLAEGARLGLPEVKRGLFPAGGGTFIGTRIPMNVALEMALTGDTVDAGRALALGLANAVVPAEQVLDVALAYAERIAANGPLGVAATKELVRLGVVDAAAAWDRLREWQPVVFGSEDAREGALAFVEKRAPVWRGR